MSDEPAGAPAVTVVAHRGAPYLARENTLASFRAALAAGADAVEIDVRLTRDGIPVVLHDRTLNRLWGRDVTLASVTAERLRELTGGGVPTLAEALATTEGVRTLIDLPDLAAAATTVAEVHALGAAERVYYCGRPPAMRAVRAADARAELALSWHRTAPLRPSLLEDLRPRWLNYRFSVLDEERARQARAEGYLVAAWTPDTRRVMRRLIAMGVDSLTTNRVATLRHLLRSPSGAERAGAGDQDW